MTFSKAIAIISALGVAISGVAMYLEQLDQFYGLIATTVGTFILLFCKALQEPKDEDF